MIHAGTHFADAQTATAMVRSTAQALDYGMTWHVVHDGYHSSFAGGEWVIHVDELAMTSYTDFGAQRTSFELVPEMFEMLCEAVAATLAS
jgi:hypothetical protein